MTRREALELQSGLNSPFGRWLLKYLAVQSTQTKENAIDFIPSSLQEQNEREQNFGRGKALADLVKEIPQTIDQLIKEGTD